MNLNKIPKSIGIFFLIWVGGGLILDLLQFGSLSGVIAFFAGIWFAIKEYKK